MARDQMRNLETFKIGNSQVNEFEYQKNRGRMTEKSEQPPDEAGSGSNRPTRAERVKQLMAEAHKKVEKRRKKSGRKGWREVMGRIQTSMKILRGLESMRGQWPGLGQGGLVAAMLLVLLAGSSQPLIAQKKTSTNLQKLPSAQKVVDDYLKAIGGKKRAALIRDATYEWTIKLKDQTMGTARTQTKMPGSFRSEMTFANGQIISAANASSAWVHGLDGQLRTLTGAEAATAKLQALLDAGRLVDLKRLNVLARPISLGDLASEPAYAVEFSMRNGARLRYWFSVSSKLLVKIEDEARKSTVRFRDYRPGAARTSVLEPHTVGVSIGGNGELLLLLERVSYNMGVADSSFYPPRSIAAIDVTTLLLEVGRNQEEVEKRVTEYAFTQKETDREISNKGEIKKETVKVFEVFPLANREPIMKLVSENGVPLSPERAAKEAKRVEEEFLKAESERDKNEQRAERRRAELERKRPTQGKEADDRDPEISQFLRVSDFVSPRRERFRDREAVVFEFRPRPGFKPSNREESLISKLVGVVWIDPVDKQVMRFEARLAESFKMAGGLLLSLRPGAGLVIEQTRMAEGVWLPYLAQVNLSMKVLLFGGGDMNKTIEWSDYKHFKGDVRDYKLDTPTAETPDKKP